jgi:hypothetical protein
MGLHPSELFSYRVAVRRCPAPIPSWRWSLLDSISIASSLLSAEASSNHWTTATFPPEQKAPSFQQLPSTPPSGPKPIRKVRRALRSADARRLRRIAELPAGAAPEGSVQRTSARSAANPKVFGGPDTPPAVPRPEGRWPGSNDSTRSPFKTEVPSWKTRRPQFSSSRAEAPFSPNGSFIARNPEGPLCSGRPRLLRRGPKTPPNLACSPSASPKPK